MRNCKLIALYQSLASGILYCLFTFFLNLVISYSSTPSSLSSCQSPSSFSTCLVCCYSSYSSFRKTLLILSPFLYLSVPLSLGAEESCYLPGLFVSLWLKVAGLAVALCKSCRISIGPYFASMSETAMSLHASWIVSWKVPASSISSLPKWAFSSSW